MPREDSLSSRFDYLFEPLDGEVPADAAVDADTAVRDPFDKDRSAPSAAPVRMAFAAFVLGTLAPQPRTTNSPTTRDPISVAPDIRAPVPSQGPGGNDRGGGLLGGGGLL